MASRKHKGKNPPDDGTWLPPRSMVDLKTGRDFKVWCRPWNEAGWMVVKVVAQQPGRKSNFWLTWNGSRFADNKDIEVLAEHHPSVYEQLILMMSRDFHGD